MTTIRKILTSNGVHGDRVEDEIEMFVRAAVAKEREACAKRLDVEVEHLRDVLTGIYAPENPFARTELQAKYDEAKWCAVAIRARKETT